MRYRKHKHERTNMEWLDKLLAPNRGEIVDEYKSKKIIRELFGIIARKQIFEKFSESKKMPEGTGTFTFKYK